METHQANQQWTAWVEVDRGALAHNFRQVRDFVGPQVRVLAVVKANAYGHGMLEAARVFVEAGADYLGVTRLEEGVELRQAGIAVPVLLFGAGLPSQAPTVVANDLTQTVCTLEMAQALSAAATEAGRTARVHIKVDSGMGRLGIRPSELVGFWQALQRLPHLHVEGVYTHFATASERHEGGMISQLSLFLAAVKRARLAGLRAPLVHAAGSAALLRREFTHLDMVRPGSLLYGQYPSPHVPRLLDLRETWQLKARVSFVKPVKRGQSIGYGADFVAKRPMTVATLPLGYCDGVMLAPVRPSRRLRELVATLRDFARRNRAGVRIRGQWAPFVGRLSMQMCCVDVSHIPGVQVGDEAIVPARRTVVNPCLPRLYHS